MFKALKNTFTWGRADRSEYWLFMLFISTVSLILLILSSTISPPEQKEIDEYSVVETPKEIEDKYSVVKTPTGIEIIEISNPSKKSTEEPENIYDIILSIFILVMLIPIFTVTARRLHDTNHRAWWMLISILPGLLLPLIIIILPSISLAQVLFIAIGAPIIGNVILLILLVLKGNAFTNRFGPQPKKTIKIVIHSENDH